MIFNTVMSSGYGDVITVVLKTFEVVRKITPILAKIETPLPCLVF